MFSGCCGVLPSDIHFPVARVLAAECSHLRPFLRIALIQSSAPTPGMAHIQHQCDLAKVWSPCLPSGHLWGATQFQSSPLGSWSLSCITVRFSFSPSCFSRPLTGVVPKALPTYQTYCMQIYIRAGLQGTRISIVLSFSLNLALSLIVPWILTKVQHTHINYQYVCMCICTHVYTHSGFSCALCSPETKLSIISKTNHAISHLLSF